MTNMSAMLDPWQCLTTELEWKGIVRVHVTTHEDAFRLGLCRNWIGGKLEIVLVSIHFTHLN